MKRYYLDHNATAPVRPEVVEIVAETMRQDGNSLSVHEEGRHAHKLVEDAREQVRTLVNAPVNGVIFTSGGTESIHYALHGAIKPHNIKRIFISVLEHAAVGANAATTGAEVETIPALPSGIVDLAWLRARLDGYDSERDGGFVVCLMFANNETGVMQPVREAADIAHDAGGLLFCDAAQAAGKIPVNFVMSGADMMSLTGHKFGGPVGIGALITGPNLPLEPQLRGGGHESNRRAGTHNVPAIAGLGLASELAKQSLARAGEIAALRNKMQDAAVAAGAKAWGVDHERLPGTLCISADGFSGATQLMTMDLAGISVSAGTACSSGKTKPSHVLTAMGASEEEASSAIRVSLGWNSTEEDADAFIREWPKAYERIKARFEQRGAA
ncbi:cysteine desulfurase family protein [Hyphococcus flavus]|uniref:Cysteine desulfurase n=1 Tax=Hyphococcus flavus TaxID=1866326 RepID=A0AAF0CER3_9PROT|nr:cysteine desulfurase family protein [Hyphococcus flavus]WDI31721.1 cysteine desulfurase family protein [Hyphococcus flavus]